MAAFLRKILGLLGGNAQPELPERVYLAAFGKHPAWDDHIDDIGLETDLLAQVKKWLYVDGVGGNIDSGGWDELAAKGQAIPFQHLFVWRFGDDVCIGRLSASRDGKGRTRYPLILCAHCTRMTLDSAIEEVAPQLEVLDRQSAAATSASSLRVVMNSTLHELRNRVADVPLPGGEQTREGRFATAADEALAKISADPSMGPDNRGLLSVMYQVQREMAEVGQHSDGNSAPPQPLRVPRCAKDPGESARLWINFLSSRLRRDVPMLLLLPLAESWLDVVVGPPVPSQLYCIRASLQTMPLTTQIPYTLDPEFVVTANRTIESSRAAYGGGGGAVAPSSVATSG